MTDPFDSHNNDPEPAASDLELRASLIVDSSATDPDFVNTGRAGTHADSETNDLATLMLSAREELRHDNLPPTVGSQDMVLRAMAAFDKESSDQSGETIGVATAAVTPLKQKRNAHKWLAAAAVTLLLGGGIGWLGVNSTRNEPVDSAAVDEATPESGSSGAASEGLNPDLSAPALGQNSQIGGNPAEIGESPDIGDTPILFDRIRTAIQSLGERLRSILGLHIP